MIFNPRSNPEAISTGPQIISVANKTMALFSRLQRYETILPTRDRDLPQLLITKSEFLLIWKRLRQIPAVLNLSNLKERMFRLGYQIIDLYHL
jgi:hypothetical protein